MSAYIMEKAGWINAIRLFLRGNYNFLTGRPLVVSFEVTSSCNADCRHCDKGGIIKDERHLSPAQIGAIYRRLKPVAVQLSGGEPLLRKDITEIVREIKKKGGAGLLDDHVAAYVLYPGGDLVDRTTRHPDEYEQKRDPYGHGQDADQAPYLPLEYIG
jgi:hypothetical protein